MGAFLGVSKWLGKPIVDVAIELGYEDDNIVVLRGDINKLREKFPDSYANLISCRHHADKRTPIQYGQDLIATWIIEDLVLKMLKANGLSVRLNGADKNRKILPHTKIKTTSDYILFFENDKTRKLELMCNYTGFWAKNQKLHLRDDKYGRLVDTKSLMLAVSVETSQFALYDFSKPIEAKYIPNHKFYGGKPVQELSITPSMMKSFELETVISEIEKILK